MFDDNEDDFCFVYYECVCEKGGLNNHDDKEMEFVCLFVCLYWWELSRLCLIIVVIVCVWEWVIFFCNCSSIGEMTSRLTPERPNENVPHRPNPRQTWRKVFCLCLLLFAVLLFFVRHFCFSPLVRLVWAGNLSPILLFFIVLFFVFSRKNGVRFFVCFVLLSASFSYSSNQYLNY